MKAHPADDLLAAHAAGRLHPAPRLVLAAHLEACATCREAVRRFEAAGGALLAEEPPIPTRADSLAKTFRRIETPPTPERRRASARRYGLPDGQLRGRRWFGVGRWVSAVDVPGGEGWALYLVRAPAGAVFPPHDHCGPEYTYVIEGAYHDGATWAHGDFIATQQDDHRLQVTDDGPCLCLIACQGGMKWTGRMKILAPLLGV